MLNRHRLMRHDASGGSRLSLNELLQKGNHAWHGVKLWSPDWSRNSHSLAVSMSCQADDLTFFLILNAYREPLEFELPAIRKEGQEWRRWIDTSLESPDDIVDWSAAPRISGSVYPAASHSVAVLFARLSWAYGG